MPCILKQRTPNSPGVITFTHNETLNGVAGKSKRVRKYLLETSKAYLWIYGVHVQGDCSYFDRWPLAPWHSFIMWPVPNAPFLANVPAELILPMNCINFMPDWISQHRGKEKVWDICVISRASEIKRITETLYILRQMITIRPDLKVILIVPDPRKLELGNRTYRIQQIDKRFFELPRKLFSCEELKNISFLSSSQSAFGIFPLSDDLIADLVARSKFLLLPSHREGVPRVLAEALLVGTPCVVSKSLRSGVERYLTTENTIFIHDETARAARQILDGLDNYGRFALEDKKTRDAFCESSHLAELRQFLAKLVEKSGCRTEGKWYLDNLHLRLACHGQKHNYQFMNNDELFFDWMGKIENLGDCEPNEDRLFGTEPISDTPKLSSATSEYLGARVIQPIRRRLIGVAKALLGT